MYHKTENTAVHFWLFVSTFLFMAYCTISLYKFHERMKIRWSQYSGCIYIYIYALFSYLTPLVSGLSSILLNILKISKSQLIFCLSDSSRSERGEGKSTLLYFYFCTYFSIIICKLVLLIVIFLPWFSMLLFIIALSVNSACYY